MSAVEKWAKNLAGRFIDRDYAPPQQPFQCHDIWLAYLVDVLGGELGDGHAPGAEGFTIEVWRQFPKHRPRLAKLLKKHTGSKGIKAGDVVFWPTGARNHPYSHVVVALGPVGADGTFRCITQNPGRAEITRLSARDVAGYLRPIPAKPVKPAPPAPKPAPPIEEDEETMFYIRLNAQTTVYAYSPLTGKKRALKTVEWNAIKRAAAAGGGAVPVVNLTADEAKHFGIAKPAR